MTPHTTSLVHEPRAGARTRRQLVLGAAICVAALFLSSAHANLTPAPLTGVAAEATGAERTAPRADRFEPLRVAPHACGVGGCMKLGQDTPSLKLPADGTALPEPTLVAPTCGSHCTRTRSSGTTLPEPPILVAPGACASGACGKNALAASSTAWPTAVPALPEPILVAPHACGNGGCMRIDGLTPPVHLDTQPAQWANASGGGCRGACQLDVG